MTPTPYDKDKKQENDMSKETLGIGDIVATGGMMYGIIGINKGWYTLDDGSKHRAADLEFRACADEATFAGIEGEVAVPEGGLTPDDDNDSDDDEEEGVKNMSTHIRKYREAYKPCVSAGGSSSMNNGDGIAQLLEGCTADEVCWAAEALGGMERDTLTAKYAHLNEGSKRMNAGNRIRGMIKRGDVTLDEAAAAIAKS